MPRSSCSICRSTHQGKNMRMLSVPKHPEKRQSWSQVCGVELKAHSRICEIHFREDDFKTLPNNNRMYLKDGILPSQSLFRNKKVNNVNETRTTVKKYRPVLLRDVTATPESVQNTIKKQDELIKLLEANTRYLTNRIITMEQMNTQLLEKSSINTDTGVKEVLKIGPTIPSHLPCLSNMKFDVELSETELIPPDCQKDESIGGNFSDFEIKEELQEPEEFINTISTTTRFFKTNDSHKGLALTKKMCPDVTIKQESLVSETLADDFGNAANNPNSLLLMSSSSSSSMLKENFQKSEHKSISALQKEAENLRGLVHSLRNENEALCKENNNLTIDLKNYKSQKFVLSDQ